MTLKDGKEGRESVTGHGEWMEKSAKKSVTYNLNGSLTIQSVTQVLSPIDL